MSAGRAATHEAAATLPRTDLTLHDARQNLAGWHFAQESLTPGEREILYVAEAVLRGMDEAAGRTHKLEEAAWPMARLPFPLSADERDSWRVYQERLRTVLVGEVGTDE